LIFSRFIQQVGVSWENFGEGDYSLQTSLFAMAGDTLAYLVLAAYLEAVLPSQVRHLPFYFSKNHFFL
jgi:hypothetical protein